MTLLDVRENKTQKVNPVPPRRRGTPPGGGGGVGGHVASFDEYIPPIDRKHSLQYATAIGLALRGLPA